MANKHTCHMTSEQWLIDANAVLDLFTVQAPSMTYNKMYMTVANAPTVYAVEVVHARWVKEWNREHLFKICYCSACKKGANKDVHDEFILSDYCPNCGAMMDGWNEDG